MESSSDPSKLMFIICGFITLFSFITFLPEDSQYHQFDFFSDQDQQQQHDQNQQQQQQQYYQSQSQSQYSYKIKEQQPQSYIQLIKNLLSFRRRKSGQTNKNNNNTTNTTTNNAFKKEDYYSNGILKSNDFKSSYDSFNNNNNSDNSFDSYITEGDVDYENEVPQEFLVAENNDLKEQLEQAILNTTAERRGRLLAEQQMIQEQEKIENMKNEFNKQEAKYAKLLELCTASIQKRKKAEETIEQLSNQMSSIIEIISTQTQDLTTDECDSLDSSDDSSSFYTNGNNKILSTAEKNNNNNNSSNTSGDKITLSIDREFFEKFESINRTIQELEMKKSTTTTTLASNSSEESSSISSSTSSSRSDHHGGKSTNLDLETLFFDLVQLSKKQLPFTLSDVVSPSSSSL